MASKSPIPGPTPDPNPNPDSSQSQSQSPNTAATYVHHKETTFKSYSAAQAAEYAKYRKDYNPRLVSFVLEHHSSTGGQYDTVLDLGTGHGNVLRAFAPHFEHAIGLDPNESMLNEARHQSEVKGVKCKNGEDLKFATGTAEDCDSVEEVSRHGKNGVDLIVAGQAAHWFNLPNFWAAAAKALRPGGTVAFWTNARLSAHPSQPHASEIQHLLDEFENVTIKPWIAPGNNSARAGYTSIPLPRDLDTSHPAHSAFPAEGHMRQDWNREGEVGIDEEYFAGSNEISIDDLCNAVGTASAVTRWRADEANKGKEDIMEQQRRKLTEIVGEGKTLRLGQWTALVMVKRG